MSANKPCGIYQDEDYSSYVGAGGADIGLNKIGEFKLHEDFVIISRAELGRLKGVSKQAQILWKDICEKSPAQVNMKTMRKCLLIDESDLIRMGACLGL